MSTQTEEVLDLLRKRPRGITPMGAFIEVGTMRLAARIHDLRQLGYDIEDQVVKVKARNGRRTYVKRYRLAA